MTASESPDASAPGSAPAPETEAEPVSAGRASRASRAFRASQVVAGLVVVGALGLLAWVVAGDDAALTNVLFGRRLAFNPAQEAQFGFLRRQLLLTAGTFIVLGAVWLGAGRWLLARFAEGLRSERPADRPWMYLFCVSVLSLFFEVLVIRWISTEVRILAFFKNVPLIAAFLGLGIGCMVSGRLRARTEVLFPAALALALILVGLGSDTYLRAISFAGATVGAGELHIWGHAFGRSWVALAGVVFYGGLAVIFAAQVLLFVPLGQMVGHGFIGLPRIPAYSVNIAGALVGIYAYNLLANLSTGPIIWFALGLLPFLWLLRDRRSELAVSAALAVLAFGVLSHTMLPRTWSSYNRLSINDSYLWKTPDGRGVIFPGTQEELGTDERPGEWVPIGKRLDVGDLFYMDMSDFGDELTSRHSELYGDLAVYSYNLPYTLFPGARSVCVLGAGGGNDVAAALRAGAERVVAVEIDREIASAGRLHHPERPYQDERVELVVDDARHFLTNTDERFDLVVFGLLDSHSLFSTFSSVRLDNYVYTLEAFERVGEILTADGAVVCTFATSKDWMTARFARTFELAYGSPPLLVIGARGSTLVSGHQDAAAVRARAEAAGAAATDVEPMPEVPLAVDDWPFMYQRSRSLPTSFLGGLLVMGIVGFALVWWVLPRDLPSSGNAHFFWLGVSFLLIEVKGISQLALVWGSTWKVTAVVIGVILVLILLANLVVSRIGVRRTWPSYLLLLASIVGSWTFQLEWVAGQGPFVGRVVPTLVLLLPILFAGIIFATTFRRASHPEVALGWNLMGGVLGGLLEYSSVVVGFRILALVALVGYVLSWLGVRSIPAEDAPRAP